MYFKELRDFVFACVKSTRWRRDIIISSIIYGLRNIVSNKELAEDVVFSLFQNYVQSQCLNCRITWICIRYTYSPFFEGKAVALSMVYDFNQSHIVFDSFWCRSIQLSYFISIFISVLVSHLVICLSWHDSNHLLLIHLHYPPSQMIYLIYRNNYFKTIYNFL